MQPRHDVQCTRSRLRFTVSPHDTVSQKHRLLHTLHTQTLHQRWVCLSATTTNQETSWPAAQPAISSACGLQAPCSVCEVSTCSSPPKTHPVKSKQKPLTVTASRAATCLLTVLGATPQSISCTPLLPLSYLSPHLVNVPAQHLQTLKAKACQMRNARGSHLVPDA